MQRLLSDSELKSLTQIYSVSDGTEIPILIKLLWNIRHFQEESLSLPINSLQLIFQQAWEMDNAIALEIMRIRNQN
jgi:hypothetical protein